jgi:hypothetical protein
LEVPCRRAYDAISHLGIENPPTGPSDRAGASYPDLERIDAWKNWWNEVKTGKRTYRFIGSDIEYGPDGPIAAVQAQKHEKRPASDEKGTAPNSSTKAPTIAMVVSALAVIVTLFGKKQSQ